MYKGFEVAIIRMIPFAGDHMDRVIVFLEHQNIVFNLGHFIKCKIAAFSLVVS